MTKAIRKNNDTDKFLLLLHNAIDKCDNIFDKELDLVLLYPLIMLMVTPTKK